MTGDQTSKTTAMLLVYNVVCRPEVPGDLLSDRERTCCQIPFMKFARCTKSTPRHIIHRMMVLSKTSIAPYVQCTIAKHAKEFWDRNLQQLLFAYRVTPTHPDGNHCFPSRTAEIHGAQRGLYSPNPCQSMRWMLATTGRRSVDYCRCHDDWLGGTSPRCRSTKKSSTSRKQGSTVTRLARE